MTEITKPSEPDSTAVLSHIEDRIALLTQTKVSILNERAGLGAIAALIIAVLLNTWGFSTQTTTYMLVWISASLYFYLFYPMLPLFLFPFRYLYNKDEKIKEEKKPKEPILKWARKIKIFKSKQIGFRLFMRFFILSLLPLTIGMIGIYLLSIIFSLYLGKSGMIPSDTSHLILVQSVGIILFYIEIFFFRRQIFRFTEYVRKSGRKDKRKIIIVGVLGLVLLVVGTIAVFLLLIAILLPGFTLMSFINVSEFVRVRSNIWVLIILVSQVIIMQYLQSVLSLRISRNMCDEQIEQMNVAKRQLESEKHRNTKEGRYESMQRESRHLREALRVLKESELYAYNRRQMFGLFPSYSIGINIPALFSLQNLNELKDVFYPDD